jgi:HEAT repeat protein
MASLSASPRRDLFISYTRDDRPFVERLARDLRDLDLKVWWDRWEMKVGDSLIEKIEEGISESSWLAVVLSSKSVRSSWVKREVEAAMVGEIQDRRLVVLPLLVSDCELPPFLRAKVFADFRSTYQEGFDALVARLSPPIDPETLDALLSQRESRILRAFNGVSGDQRAKYLRHLRELSRDERTEKRLAALVALVTIRDPSLLSDLKSMIGDPSVAVRQRTAFYLGRLRRRDALPAIEHLMQDQNSGVRSAARTAYKTVTGRAP